MAGVNRQQAYGGEHLHATFLVRAAGADKTHAKCNFHTRAIQRATDLSSTSELGTIDVPQSLLSVLLPHLSLDDKTILA